MDASLQQRWVDALRSGKYKQGKGALRNADNEFCCLGVLGDLLDDGTRWSAEPHDAEDSDRDVFVYSYADGDASEFESYLPSSFLSIEQQDGLAALNDSRDYTFAQIADYIENQAQRDENDGSQP